MNSEKVHQGHNVRRFREILRMKQEALALELGGDWTQKRISLLEQRELIDPSILQEVAQALKVPVEAIENMSEEQAIYNISCSYSESAVNYNSRIEVQNVNSLEKITQLHEEKIAIYERMLKEKDEMMVRLEQLIKGK